jgi:hypothetical protein
MFIFSYVVHSACPESNATPPIAQLEEHGTITGNMAIPRLLVRLQFGGKLFLTISTRASSEHVYRKVYCDALGYTGTKTGPGINKPVNFK